MSALFEKLDINEDEIIDDTELKEIQRVLATFKVDAAQVAKTNDTSDTLALLKAASLAMKELLAKLTPDQARAFLAAHNSGQQASLFGNLPTAESSTQSPKQLGGGIDPTQQAHDTIDKNPQFAPYVPGIVETLQKAVDDGATENELHTRAVFSNKVLLGKEKDYQFVQGNPGTAPTLRMVVDARSAHDSAITAQQQAEQQLNDERSDKVNGSLAFRLKQATDNPPMPANAVKKDDVRPHVETLKQAGNAAVNARSRRGSPAIQVTPDVDQALKGLIAAVK